MLARVARFSTILSIVSVSSFLSAPVRSIPIEASSEPENGTVSTEENDHIRGTQWKTLNGKPPVLFAHRGERVLLPANTLPAYEIAAIEGADYLEPDLFLTKDDVFVCYHDLYLKAESDVESHPEFEHLRRNFTSVDSEEHGPQISTNDWVIKDFTYAELQTLRVRQPNVGIRPQYFNYMFGIPTFQEFLDVAHRMSVKLARKIGIAPELKFPAFYNRDKSPFYMENKFLEIMRANGYSTIDSPEENCTAQINETYITKIVCPPVIVQSFHQDTLKYLRTQLRHELLLLLGYQPKDYTYIAFKEIAAYANYVAIFKDLFLDPTYSNSIAYPNLLEPGSIVTVAHRMGLKVAVFTFRDSREYSQVPGNANCIGPGGISMCPLAIRTKKNEMNYFFRLGVDALFIENVAESLLIKVEYENHGKA